METLFSKPYHQDLAIPGLPERILISEFSNSSTITIFPLCPPGYDYSMDLDNQGLQGLWGAKHGERVKQRLDVVS